MGALAKAKCFLLKAEVLKWVAGSLAFLSMPNIYITFNNVNYAEGSERSRTAQLYITKNNFIYLSIIHFIFFLPPIQEAPMSS